MNAMLKQIQEDDGECGSRARKNRQRNHDASPDKPGAEDEADETSEASSAPAFPSWMFGN